MLEAEDVHGHLRLSVGWPLEQIVQPELGRAEVQVLDGGRVGLMGLDPLVDQSLVLFGLLHVLLVGAL